MKVEGGVDKMENQLKEHTFVICAYKESEYLEECIQSLRGQKLRSKIIMVTSTPNDRIRKMADQYQIELYINEGESGITQDWNFGLEHVHTKYATIAHQDDTYEPAYLQTVLAEMEKASHPLIGFTGYSELRNGEKVYKNVNLNIKRKMLAPLKVKGFQGSRFVRRRILSLGDPICCPAVTFCMDNLKKPIFQNGFRSCEDWEAWENISRQKGQFVYCGEPLMSHRIHEESATTAIIGDNARQKENYIMYCKFWPPVIAGLINKFYSRSEKSNDLS